MHTQILNGYDFDFYQHASKQYNDKELFMAALSAKLLLQKALNHYNDNLKMRIKITTFKYSDIYVYVDCGKKDIHIMGLCMLDTHEVVTFRCMFGEQHLSAVMLENQQTFIKDIEPALRYILIAHYDDIVALCDKTLTKLTQTDSLLSALVEDFKATHKGENDHEV